MTDYAVEKNVYLMFNYENDVDKLNKTLDVKLTIDTECEICEFDIEKLVQAGLITKEQYNDVMSEEDVTTYKIIFE